MRVVLATSSQMKNSLLGWAAVLMSNSCFLANSYIAKAQPVTPGEILSARSVLQIVLFGAWAFYQRTRPPVVVDGEKPNKRNGPMSATTWVLVLVANILLSASQILCFTAVKMIPISDFVTLCFTSPVFSLLASAILLKRQFCSIRETFLCTLVVAGATMVSQPSFIFGEVNQGYPDYLLGSMLSVSVAALVGLFLVASSKTKEVPIGIFMTAGGLTSLVMGVIHIGVFPLQEIPDAKHIALLCLMASLSLIAVVGLRVAALFISPVMVSMIRTFEIVMSLALEIITQSMGVKLPNQEFLNFTSETFMFKVAGCAIVTLSAVLMAIPADDKSCFDQCGKATVEPEENSSINSTSTYGSKVQYNSTSTLVSAKSNSMTKPE